MNKIVAVVSVIIVIAIIAIAYVAISGNHQQSATSTTSAVSTTISNQTQNTTTFPTTATSTIIAGGSNSTTQSNVSNMTLTQDQVISSLGTGWIAASQYNYGASNVTLPDGPNVYVSGYGISNFSKSGSFLTVQWVKFQTEAQAAMYINTTFTPPYPSSARQTGSINNATYVFYSGDSINLGQAATAMAAYYKNYAVIIINNGTTFPLSQAEQLLTNQISNLNATS